MLCGNDPRTRGRLLPGDLAAVAWFEEYLRWSKLPDAERAATPEPIAPGATEGLGWTPTETERP
jgi:hypothetical protein